MRTFKPPYLVKRIDNGELLEGPFNTRVRAETRADQLAKSLGLDLFVHSKNAYGKWRVWYRTDRKALIIDLTPRDYETERTPMFEAPTGVPSGLS